MKRLVITVRGRVQGVFFRHSARVRASELGLVGSAKNGDDGSLRIAVEGEPDALEAFAAWCRDGPPLARVDAIAVEEKEGTGEFRDFRVV